MGEKTNIAWTEATWNPWVGCEKVSPGCDNCYAEREMNRWGRDFYVVRRTKDPTFYAPLKKWKEPKLIFTCSFSDFFHADADQWREDAWKVIEATPWHTYQILTKRPSRMLSWLKTHEWPSNAWAGVSVESQQYAHRLDVLAKVPAPVRFVSAEPLLEKLNLTNWLGELCGEPCECPMGNKIQWVIAGGESGRYFRALDLDWIRSLRDQCAKAGVPFFYKQDAGPVPVSHPTLDGRLHEAMPDWTPVARAPVTPSTLSLF